MKAAIFGGTFDPVHNGHLKMIDTARKLLAPDEIVIVPTGNMILTYVRNCVILSKRYIDICQKQRGRADAET